MNPDIYSRFPAPAVWADGVLVVHAATVVFVVAGLVLILVGGPRGWEWVRNIWFRVAHLVTIGIVVAQAWLGRLCPLTIWEAGFRRAAGQVFHDRSFIEHWVGRVLFFDLPWWLFLTTYTIFASLVILAWWRYPPSRPARPPL